MAIGTPVIVGQNSGTASTVIVTTTQTAPAGQLLLLLWGGDNTVINTLTNAVDQVSNTYTLGTGADQASAHVRAAWCENPTALPSGNTNTATGGATQNAASVLVTVPGTKTPTSFDKQSGGSTGAGTAPSIAESAAGTAGRIVFGFVSIALGSGDAFTEATGWTSLGSQVFATTNLLRVAYKMAAGTGAETYNPTLGTSRTYAVQVASFDAIPDPTPQAAIPDDGPIGVDDPVYDPSASEGMAWWDATNVIDTPVEIGNNTAVTGSTTLVVTTTVAAAVGTLLYVSAQDVGTSAPAISSIADSAGNTWTTDSVAPASATVRVRGFWTNVSNNLPIGGTITITYASTSGAKNALAFTVTGAKSPTPLDVENATGGAGTAASPSISTPTLSQSGDLVVAMFSANGISGDTYTESSGFASMTAVGSLGTNLHTAYQIASSTTAITFNPTTTSRQYATQVVAFSPAPAAIDPVLGPDDTTPALDIGDPTFDPVFSEGTAWWDAGAVTDLALGADDLSAVPLNEHDLIFDPEYSEGYLWWDLTPPTPPTQIDIDDSYDDTDLHDVDPIYEPVHTDTSDGMWWDAAAPTDQALSPEDGTTPTWNEDDPVFDHANYEGWVAFDPTGEEDQIGRQEFGDQPPLNEDDAVFDPTAYTSHDTYQQDGLVAEDQIGRDNGGDASPPNEDDPVFDPVHSEGWVTFDPTGEEDQVQSRWEDGTSPTSNEDDPAFAPDASDGYSWFDPTAEEQIVGRDNGGDDYAPDVFDPVFDPAAYTTHGTYQQDDVVAEDQIGRDNGADALPPNEDDPVFDPAAYTTHGTYQQDDVVAEDQIGRYEHGDAPPLNEDDPVFDPAHSEGWVSFDPTGEEDPVGARVADDDENAELLSTDSPVYLHSSYDNDPWWDAAAEEDPVGARGADDDENIEFLSTDAPVYAAPAYEGGSWWDAEAATDLALGPDNNYSVPLNEDDPVFDPAYSEGWASFDTTGVEDPIPCSVDGTDPTPDYSDIIFELLFTAVLDQIYQEGINNFTPSLSDSVTVTDTVVLNLSTTLSDSVSVADNFASAATTFISLSDTVTATDTTSQALLSKGNTFFTNYQRINPIPEFVTVAPTTAVVIGAGYVSAVEATAVISYTHIEIVDATPV